MKNLLRILLATTITTSALQAQVSLDYSGFYSSAPQSSYTGWGGGTNLLFAPIELNPKSSFFKVGMQLGAGFYIGGAGQKELTGVITDAHGPKDISFSNGQASGYGLARFTMSAEGKRRTTYVDVFAGARSTSVSMTMHSDDHDDCDFTSLNKSVGVSGGIGTGILIGVLPGMNLDLGLQWQGSTAPGKFIDMKSVVNTGDGVAYNMKNAPAGMLFVKVGIQFQLNKTCCNVHNCKIPDHHVKACTLEH